jgi:hypothetical protein
MRQARRGTALWGTVVLALAIWGCETTRNLGGIQRDLTEPTIDLTVAGPDTQDIQGGLKFNITAVDNLGLKSIRLTFSSGCRPECGGSTGVIDTTFTSQVLTYNSARTITFPANSGAGGGITIIGQATDGAFNSAADTIFIYLRNVQALQVTLVSPQPNAVASQNRGIAVHVEANQNGGIAKIGFLVSPSTAVTNPTVPPNDSIIFLGAPNDTVVYIDTVIVVAGTGTFDVVGFAVDAAGRPGFSNTVTVTIQSVLNDATPPLVAHKLEARVEVDDTVTVRATDASGISRIGFRVDTGGVLMKFDTVDVSAGNLTDVTRRFSLGLGGLSQFPATITVRGYACDLSTFTPGNNCSFTNNTTLLPSSPSGLRLAPPSGPARAVSALIDTVIVVGGVTIALPAGGRIADAIFNANLNELYLTNPVKNRVEIFQVANSTFVATGISTPVPGPWGIALWPRDTLGNYGDSIVVANSGGTSLSIIDVRPAVRRLQWRHALPNFLIETYKVTSGGNGTTENIVVHDVSDRPQYVATVCRAAGGTACAPDSIFALYSTAPTVSSSEPFSGRATLRMEKLINTTNPALLFSKFFWEIGATPANLGTDTLRIEMIRGATSQVVLSACAGVTVRLASFGLGDSTYARNSGNFTHAFFGEGGNIAAAFARVMAYDARRSITGVGVIDSSCVGFGGRTMLAAGENHVDFGMSPGAHVSDFISNTGTKVSAIATNFNGLTNVVRADSIYYLDANLRLEASSCTLGLDGTCLTGAPGMDMNYFHDFAPGGSCTPACGGSGSPDNRLLFAARSDANIDVFDTYHGAQLPAPFATIPLRDPIIGPLRVARDATGQVLFGISARGLVMVRIPTIINPNPAPGTAGNR